MKIEKILFGVIIGVCFALVFISFFYVNDSKEPIKTKCMDAKGREIIDAVCLKDPPEFDEPWNTIFWSAIAIMASAVAIGGLFGVFD